MRIEAPIWPTIMGIVMRPDSVGDGAAGELEVLREEHARREHRDADRDRGDHGEREGAVLEERHRHDGLGHEELGDDEADDAPRPRCRS